MTGFGQAALKDKTGTIKVEIRTINNRFFDITPRLPEKFYIFEDKVRTLVYDKIKRGKVTVNVVFDEKTGAEKPISIDEKAARHYYNRLMRLKNILRLEGGIKLENILSYPGIINYQGQDVKAAEIWPALSGIIEKALERLVKDRLHEGGFLAKDLVSRAEKIEKTLATIKNRSKVNIEQYRKRLAKRVKDLSSGRELDNARLETEVAIFAKNCDIQEEITRIKGHLLSFKKCVNSNGEIGKKLDFIAQELHREINTIGSKASDFKISQGVIQVKSEIEKIREQVKNIE